MTRYLVKQTISFKGDSSTHYFGKQDMTFSSLDERMFPYSVMKYGYETIPAAKRSNTYKNRTGFVFSVDDVRIVKIDITDKGIVSTELDTHDTLSTGG